MSFTLITLITVWLFILAISGGLLVLLQLHQVQPAQHLHRHQQVLLVLVLLPVRPLAHQPVQVQQQHFRHDIRTEYN